MKVKVTISKVIELDEAFYAKKVENWCFMTAQERLNAVKKIEEDYGFNGIIDTPVSKGTVTLELP